MKQFDSRNIDRRAGKLLDYHVALLEEGKGKFITECGNYYQFKKKQEDYIRIGYNKRKKLLTRTFNLEIKSVTYDLCFAESFYLKLQFKGFPRITGACFTGNKNSRKYQGLFEDNELIKAILAEAGKVEIAHAAIRYDPDSRKLEITVCPYGGAYLWVIFPPVFYDMRLSEEEINAVYRIMELITDHAGRWSG